MQQSKQRWNISIDRDWPYGTGADVNAVPAFPGLTVAVLKWTITGMRPGLESRRRAWLYLATMMKGDAVSLKFILIRVDPFIFSENGR